MDTVTLVNVEEYCNKLTVIDGNISIELDAETALELIDEIKRLLNESRTKL
tara:strand:- start:13983 stop:14135 length:153 start_codon:yes stop_codon:yes gene_type:complete